MKKVFDYKYLSNKHLRGFQNYKYSAIDTSPLSQYLMHPAWNASVKLFPKWIAPNLITFVGFLCMVINVVVLLIYDYDCAASGRPGDDVVHQQYGLPKPVFIACAVLLFLAYNLDGIDGKQARRIGVSGPLGEMFDHGLDSYIVFLIPFCLFSVFGRDEFSISVFRGYLMVMSVVLNFYVSHWEKYNTGTLYLPWGYDVSMWVSTLLLFVAGLKGPEVYKVYVLGGITFTQALEVAVHCTGLFTTLPIAIYNVYLSHKAKKIKTKSLAEALRPVGPILILCVTMTLWALKSPNNIIEKDARAFMLAFGTVFSNIASRLIVAEMSEQQCDAISWINVPLVVIAVAAVNQPNVELPLLHCLLFFSILAHVHYGVCVVRQMCRHFKISCFTVPKSKWK